MDGSARPRTPCRPAGSTAGMTAAEIDPHQSMASMGIRHIDHVLSTRVLRSAIFADLIRRAAAAAAGVRVTGSIRPDRTADIHHYHRPNLERRLLARSVATVHHDPRDSDPWLGLGSFLPRYREAAVVHCLNSLQRDLLAEHGIRHTVVVPHGLDRALFPPPAAPRAPQAGRLRLGIVSRRYANGVKGEARLEALLEHLDPGRVSFVLAGVGRWQEARLLRAHGFQAESFERPPYRLLPEIYRRIDALLILSLFEGGPASLPEALGSGLPVLCTRVGMANDMVTDQVNGLFLEGQAKSDGARLMALLDDHGEGLARLMLGAFTRAAAVASWDEVFAEWRRFYVRLVG